MKLHKSTEPAILFDLDGTLVDTVYQHVVAWSNPLKAAGIVLPDWKVHRRVGMSGKSMLQQLFREHGKGGRKINIKAPEANHYSVCTNITRTVRGLAGST